MDSTANRAASRLARLGTELVALADSADPARVDACGLATATAALERDLAQVRTALIGGAR